MNRKILTEYADMRKEAEDLRKRIYESECDIAKLENSFVTDSASCGEKTIRTAKVTGISTELIRKKRRMLKARQARLAELEQRLVDVMDQAEAYIDSMEKSELRVMFRFYFIDDMTYIMTAAAMNHMFPKRRIKYTDENVKKRIQRFLKNVPQCPEEIC